jgi:dihydropteroate synthase
MSKQIIPVLEWPTGKLDFSSGCLVMGILNITPDSFSDGGLYYSAEKAIEHGLEMIKTGAVLIDIGPESTRPGAAPVEPSEQIRRAVPVIEALRQQTDIPISIDTFNPDVAQAAIEAGANILNDITALSNLKMAQLAADKKIPVILMHMQGTPSTMQKNPQYTDVTKEVTQSLLTQADYAEKAGIPKERIFIDPGIGFGKTMEHNLLLLNHLEALTQTDYRVVVGTSRKRFIGQITGKDTPADRVFGTAATVAISVQKGASIVRVHDVAQMADVVKVINALNKTSQGYSREA